LATLHPSDESVNKFYCKSSAGRGQESKVTILEDDALLIEGLRKRKIALTCTSSLSDHGRGARVGISCKRSL